MKNLAKKTYIPQKKIKNMYNAYPGGEIRFFAGKRNILLFFFQMGTLWSCISKLSLFLKKNSQKELSNSLICGICDLKVDLSIISIKG